MTAERGLFGREEELRAARDALGEKGCVIAGPAGVGKSRLAADAAAGSGRTVIRVVASAAAGTVPFGAVSHLLVPGAASTIGEVVAALRDGRLGPAPLVLVDDAHLLDDASAALVLAIATTGVAPLLVTVRTREPTPDAVSMLWRDRLLDRVDLQPLSATEVELLVDELLGAPSHAHVYDWVHRLAGGNPLYVTELVDDARRSGRIEQRDRRWHLGEGNTRFERLQDLLGAHVGSVSDAARPVLELLAMGAPMPLALVEDLVPGPGLEELERAALARVTDDRIQGLVVDLAHPLYGELVRDHIPQTAARRIRRQLAGALVRHGADGPADRLRIARLLLESGQVDEERFLDACSLALHHGAPDLARRFAAALPPSLPAALQVARSLLGAGRFAEVDAVLAPFEAAAASEPIPVATIYVSARVHGLIRGPGGQPDEGRRLIDRAEGWHDHPDWRALIAMARCLIAVRNRAYDVAATIVEAPLAEPDVSAAYRRELLLAWGLGLSRLARIDDYEALLAEVDHLTDELGGADREPVANTMRREGARSSAARDVPGVRQRVVARLAAAHQVGEPFEYVAMLLVLAHVDHVQGHHADARATFERSLDHLVGADAWNLRPMTYVMLSITLAYLGEPDLARRALEHSEQLIAEMPGVAPWVAPDTARAHAMVEMAAGNVLAAREQLLEVAATCGGDVLVAAESLHVALLLGADARRCVDGLEALAGDAQDDAVHLWARHARALADTNPPAQLAAAEAFEAAGLDLDAAQAAALAAAGFRAVGSKSNAGRASLVAERCAARCPGVRVPALVRWSEGPDLTGREREIALLAARGASNRAIAAELTLSVRTVETYVLRVCRKLGVNDRAALAEVLLADA